MVKQRFLTLFRRWFLTIAKVFGPILVYQFVVLVREHFHYVRFSMVDVLMATLMALALVGLLCGLWAWGEWAWSKLLRLRGFGSELRRCCKNYWRPEPVRATKA